MPSTEALSGLYGREYFLDGGRGYPDYVADAPSRRRQARRYMVLLRRAGLVHGRLLDVGCAAGFFLDEARHDGWTAEGCDVSGYAVDYAVQVLGLPVQLAAFPDVTFPDRSWDVITCFNAFEHFPSPVASARRFGNLLRAGGCLLIETWDCESPVARLFGAKWHQYDPGRIAVYLNRRALSFLFPAPEWRLVTYRSISKWITVRHALSALGMSGFPRRVTGIDVPYTLGDLKLAVLERL